MHLRVEELQKGGADELADSDGEVVVSDSDGEDDDLLARGNLDAAAAAGAADDMGPRAATRRPQRDLLAFIFPVDQADFGRRPPRKKWALLTNVKGRYRQCSSEEHRREYESLIVGWDISPTVSGGRRMNLGLLRRGADFGRSAGKKRARPEFKLKGRSRQCSSEERR